MATTRIISQVIRSSSISNHRRSQFLNRGHSLLFTSSPLTKIGLRLEGGSSSNCSRTVIKCSNSYNEGTDGYGGSEIKAHVGEDSRKVYGTAKIHDFCFGIPFGGLVLTAGLLGFIFSRNLSTLGTNVLIGGGVLALSTTSLKVWRQAKSSLPFVLGQAVLAATLVWMNLQAYSLTKKVFPAGFFLLISAAMLLFYLHVMISGGNPPPKKLPSSAAASS